MAPGILDLYIYVGNLLMHLIWNSLFFALWCDTWCPFAEFRKTPLYDQAHANK